MSLPRRRIVRSVSTPARDGVVQQQRVQKLRQKLEHERLALTRWQARLRRAFNTVEKCQKRIDRLHRQLTKLEE